MVDFVKANNEEISKLLFDVVVKHLKKIAAPNVQSKFKISVIGMSNILYDKYKLFLSAPSNSGLSLVYAQCKPGISS